MRRHSMTNRSAKHSAAACLLAICGVGLTGAMTLTGCERDDRAPSRDTDAQDRDTEYRDDAEHRDHDDPQRPADPPPPDDPPPADPMPDDPPPPPR